jgi:outer membrane receptor protein involved in Fe transport
LQIITNKAPGTIPSNAFKAMGGFGICETNMLATGFSTFSQDIDVRSTVPITMDIPLMIGAATTNITITESAVELIEQDSTDHTDVDRGLFDKLPLESQSSSVSSLLTLASPGVVADSNGLFHGLGDHAENSFSVDGQPITDQQSKVFSNQIPVDSIESLEVIQGAPPAEYGGKTSLIAVVTTRSGLGQTQAHGSVTASYGSFGSTNEGFDLQYGGQKWGNFIAVSGLNTSRFLDPPEFVVLHDKGNEENVFDRVDFKPSNNDTIQLNVQFTRSWFQTPNTWDQQLQECTFFDRALQRRSLRRRFRRAQSDHRCAPGPNRSALPDQNVRRCP